MYLVKGNEKIFKIISTCLACVFMFSFIVPREALAGGSRSNSGGGEIKEFGAGDFAKTAGIAVGGAVIGSAIGAGLNSAYGQAAGSLGMNVSKATTEAAKIGIMGSMWGSLTNMGTYISGYNTYMATAQVSRAVGMMGSYYQLNPKTTFLISSVATGATSGFLNPNIYLGKSFDASQMVQVSNMAKGAFVGTLGELAKGSTIILIDGDKIKEGKSPGIGAQLAGMAAGSYATSLGRGLFSPPKKSETFFDIKENGGLQQVHYDSAKGGSIQSVQDAKPIEKADFENTYGKLGSSSSPGRYQQQFISEGIVKVIDTQVTTSNLFVEPLKYTINQWPNFAVSALSMYAVNGLPENKQYLAPLVGGVTRAFSAPILSSLASVYNLQFMDEEDKILHVAMMKSMANEHEINEINKALQSVRSDDAATYISEASNILKNRGMKELPFYISQEGKLEIISGTDKELEGRLNETEKSLTDNNPKLQRDTASLARNLTQTVIHFQLENIYKQAGFGVDNVLEHAKLTRPEMVVNQSWQGMRFGLLDALTSGGLQAAMGKNFSLEKDPTRYMLAGIVSNFGTAMARGLVWHAFGGIKEGESEWIRKPHEVTSEDPTKYKEFAPITGLSPNKGILSMEFKKEKPTLVQSIGESLRLASLDYARETFSFGYPDLENPKDAKNITPLRAMQYTDHLRYLASLNQMKGITGVLAYHAGSAGISAASNNIQTSVSHIPGLRDVFSLQPQKLVATNAPKVPFTILSLSYSDALLHANSTFYAPFTRVETKPATSTGNILKNIIERDKIKNVQTERGGTEIK